MIKPEDPELRYHRLERAKSKLAEKMCPQTKSGKTTWVKVPPVPRSWKEVRHG